MFATFIPNNFYDPFTRQIAYAQPISGSFSLTYDTTVNVSSGTLNSISLSIGGYQYTTQNTGFNYSSVYGNVVIGGLINGITLAAVGTNDFFWSFSHKPLTTTMALLVLVLLFNHRL